MVTKYQTSRHDSLFAVVLQSSGSFHISCQAAIRQISGSCQEVIRQSQVFVPENFIRLFKFVYHVITEIPSYDISDNVTNPFFKKKSKGYKNIQI